MAPKKSTTMKSSPVVDSVTAASPLSDPVSGFSGVIASGFAAMVLRPSGRKRKFSAVAASEQVAETTDEELSNDGRDDGSSTITCDDDDDDDDQVGGDCEDVEGRGEEAGDKEITQSSNGTVFAWDSVARCPGRLPFTGTPGLRVPLRNASNVLEIFHRFITDEMIENIVVETNRRAMQRKANLSEINIHFTT